MSIQIQTFTCEHQGCQSRLKIKVQIQELYSQTKWVENELAKLGWATIPLAVASAGTVADKHFCPVHKATATNP